MINYFSLPLFIFVLLLGITPAAMANVTFYVDSALFSSAVSSTIIEDFDVRAD